MIHKLIIVIIIVNVMAASTQQAVDWTTRPRIQRTGKNLAPNPSFQGAAGWLHRVAGEHDEGQSLYDETVSRTPGSGSIKLTNAAVKDWNSDGIRSSAPIPIEPGITYTFAVYMKTNSWPPPVAYLYASYVEESGKWVRNILHGGGRWSNISATGWEECVTFLTPKPGDQYIRLSISLADQVDGVNRSVWVDDVYFGEGRGFEQPPAPKIPFDGTQTRVDELGNIEILREGNWEPFFPLFMYVDGTRPENDAEGWKIYSRQGFNGDMWAGDANSIQRAKDAISDFNPQGMMSGMQIAQYILHDGWAYNDLEDLEKKINAIKERGLMDYLLFYYWDNEHVYGDWKTPGEVTSKIMELDVDDQGKRMHPIYALNGNEGLARKYNCDNGYMTDITGDYIGSDGGAAGTRTDGFVALDNIQGQRQPAAIAQINRGAGAEMRPRLYAAIAKGAKGMGFWRDYYNNPERKSVTELPWWSDFPNLRREIDAMMPLIRQPHWTEWTAHCAAADVDFGTRTLRGEGYIIAANYNSSDTKATFIVEGLPYRPGAVRDYFTDEEAASFNGSAFTVTLPAYGSGVYRIADTLPQQAHGNAKKDCK